MTNIHVNFLDDTVIDYLYKNSKFIAQKIQENKTNDWILEDFPKPVFVEKKFIIPDFDLPVNQDLKDKKKYYDECMNLYQALKDLPPYVLSEEGFWLWLSFDKFYPFVRSIHKVEDSTFLNHWLFGNGNRRSVFFGFLSRMYFMVKLTHDGDNYDLTQWVCDNPERFVEMSWRSFSSEDYLIRGAVRGEKKAVEELQFEDSKSYRDLAKYISLIGSARLLDAITEEDMEKFVYEKTKEMIFSNKKFPGQQLKLV